MGRILQGFSEDDYEELCYLYGIWRTRFYGSKVLCIFFHIIYATLNCQRYQDIIALLSKVIFTKQEAHELLEDINQAERIMVENWGKSPYVTSTL